MITVADHTYEYSWLFATTKSGIAAPSQHHSCCNHLLL